MNDNLKKGIQERNLDYLAENHGFEFTDSFFPYDSGKIGPYYVSCEVVMNNPNHYRQACRDLSDLVQVKLRDYHIDVIAGGESKDWIFSIPVLLNLARASAMIYKNGSVVGEVKGKNVVIISDLNNQGFSSRECVNAVKGEEGNVHNIFFYVDRLEDGVKVMEDLGLRSESVIPLDGHAWDYLQKIGVINEEIYRNLRERMGDRDNWAKKMLFSNTGLKRLAQLYDNCGKPRVVNVLRKGYPDLRDDIIEGIARFSRFRGNEIRRVILGDEEILIKPN